MKKGSFIKFCSAAVILFFCVLFVLKFGGPGILRLYIETGIGNCQKIPILCKAPEQEIMKAGVNEEYLRQLSPHKFPRMSISVPKGFTVVQEKVKKVYYKRGKVMENEAVIYIDQQEPNFLINLFPKLRKHGIQDDFELMKHAMFARINKIKDLDDAFFVILKSVFTPDLGDQNDAKMLQATIGNKRCFVNYNITGKENYFDFNIFDDKGSFFKVYIRDKNALLDLDKALTIISTARKISLPGS